MAGCALLPGIAAGQGCARGSGEDFANEDLTGADLTARDLRCADFSGSNLTRARLDAANLSAADFRDAVLVEASLVNADLTHARFANADLSAANLSGARLMDADVRSAKGVFPRAPEAPSEYECAVGSRKVDPVLFGTDLRGKDLHCVDLSGADLVQDDLSGADLSRALLADARLIQADLKRTMLREAVLDRADLTQADLPNADLTRASLREARLGQAHLENARLRAADLDGADLDQAALRGADLSFASLEGARLVQAELGGADFFGASLRGADLTQAKTEGAKFEGADLTDVRGLEKGIELTKRTGFFLGLAVVILLGWVLLLFLISGFGGETPSPGPATNELGPESPAVANLLTHSFRLSREALPATVLDLAARGVIAIEQIALGEYVYRMGDDWKGGITEYEFQVALLIESRAVDGVTPLAELTAGQTSEARRWFLQFYKEVVKESKSLGLSRDFWGWSRIGLLALLAPAPFVALALALRPLWGFVFFFSPVLLVMWAFVVALWSSPRQRATPAGLLAAKRWLGVKDYLSHSEEFPRLPPAAVTVWGRHLAYAAALGAADAAVGAIPLASIGSRHLR